MRIVTTAVTRLYHGMYNFSPKIYRSRVKDQYRLNPLMATSPKSNLRRCEASAITTTPSLLPSNLLEAFVQLLLIAFGKLECVENFNGVVASKV